MPELNAQETLREIIAGYTDRAPRRIRNTIPPVTYASYFNVPPQMDYEPPTSMTTDIIEETQRCQCCDSTIKSDDEKFYVDGLCGYVCHRCVRICDCCHENFYRGTLYRVSVNGKTEYRCNNCFEQCCYCGHRAEKGTLYFSKQFGKYFCEDCRKQIKKCSFCKKDVLDNYLHVPDFYSDKCCDSCYSLLNYSYHDYHHTKPCVFLGKSKHHRYYGVEIEVSKQDEDDYFDCNIYNKLKCINPSMTYKPDSSILNGFEIVSQPATLKYHKKEMLWESIFKEVKNNELYGDSATSCGLHIHVDRKAFKGQISIAKVALFINTNQDFVEKIARRRENSRYYKYKKQKKFLDYIYDSDRYTAINVTNSNTIEFRMFRSTTRPERLYLALEFIDSLISFCREHNVVSFLRQEYILNLYKDYIKRNRKLWPVFCKWLKENEGK